MKPEAVVIQRALLLPVLLLLAFNLTPCFADSDSVEDPARTFEIQGHRGAGTLAPENSIAAFEKAIGLGVDTLEMDAQSTSDRVLVVSHDQKIGANCHRADGGSLRSRLFKDLTLGQVQALRCAEGAAIPTLEEVLRLARAAPYPVRANVEIKLQRSSRGIPATEFAALLVDVIDAAGMRGRTLVQSFDAEALKSMRQIAPDIPRAAVSRDRGAYLAMVKDTTASALLPRRDRLREEDIEPLHALGAVVIPWVVDDPGEMRKLRSWGVDGIITNRPDVALRFRDGPAAAPPDAAASPPPPTPWPPPASQTPSDQPPGQIADPATPRAYTLSQIRKVAVFYFTSGGRTDTYLTSLFIEELRKRGSHELIDPLQLGAQYQDGDPYHPTGMLDTLFEEADRESAQAIIIGLGKWYNPGGPGRGFRLEVRLVEIREGNVLWQATAASGSTLSGPGAKREVVRKVLRDYPGARR